MNNIDTATSYVNEENLNKALARKGLASLSPLVVRNREGRWTAVFSAARMTSAGVAWIAAATAGFIVMN